MHIFWFDFEFAKIVFYTEFLYFYVPGEIKIKGMPGCSPGNF
jgi:hypothetical protein